MMARIVSFLALISLVCSAVLSQVPLIPLEQKTQKGQTDKVDQLFAEWDKPNLPGCALGVIRNGQFIYQRGYGMANLDYHIPIDSKTVFYIASMSKQFTAMSVALLAEQGKLALDDEVRQYLPEIPQYQSPVTIRHLIYHTSGIRDFIVLKYLAGLPTESVSSDGEMYETMARTTNEEVFQLIARQKGLNFAPGEQYMYSNSNYILLAEIVKKVSGQSLTEFADENIFQPLRMVNTHYYDDLMTVVKNRATGYSPLKKGSFAPVPTNNGTAGPAGVLTTVEDLLLWDRNFYTNKLGKSGPDLINLILTPGRLSNGDQLQYAFGLVHYKYKGLNAVGHDGGFFGFKTSMNRFPEQRFTVICLCNARNAPMDVLADQVADIYLTDQFKPNAASKGSITQTSVNLSEPELAKFVGIYRNPITEGLWMLSLKDGKLVDPGGGGSVLTPIAKNRFQVLGQPVELRFEMSAQGSPIRMLKITGGGQPQIYEPVKRATPSLRQLSDYTGVYNSTEIGATYSFNIQNGKLMLQRKKAKSIELNPTFPDNFWNDEFGYIKFRRNRQNRVDELLLTSGWIRRLRFNRTK